MLAYEQQIVEDVEFVQSSDPPLLLRRDAGRRRAKREHRFVSSLVDVIVALGSYF